MRNLRMSEKLTRGEARDVGHFPQTPEGDFILPEGFYSDSVDYCVAVTETWIWSIGRRLSDGAHLASTTAKFYNNPDFKTVWLR